MLGDYMGPVLPQLAAIEKEDVEPPPGPHSDDRVHRRGRWQSSGKTLMMDRAKHCGCVCLLEELKGDDTTSCSELGVGLDDEQHDEHEGIAESYGHVLAAGVYSLVTAPLCSRRRPGGGHPPSLGAD